MNDLLKTSLWKMMTNHAVSSAHDGRYYTKEEANKNFLVLTDGTLNGDLNVSNNLSSGTITVGSRLSGSTVGTNSSVLGYNCVASGSSSHAEGQASTASVIGSHAEGYETIASGTYSHSEGTATTASGMFSHAEGCGTTKYGIVASGYGSHAEGYCTTASGIIASNSGSHAEGARTSSSGYGSHAEGALTSATSDGDHAEGCGTTSSGNYGSHAEGYQTLASSTGSHAEGYETIASGIYSHAEGSGTLASGSYSHAEGYCTTASGASEESAHAEGYYTIASGNYSHAEGYKTIASSNSSHAEGHNTTAAVGNYSHAEGSGTLASGNYSHAEGHKTTASGDCSHAEGSYTRALSYQHAEGNYNNINTATTGVASGTDSGTAFVIGNGTPSSPSNAFRVTYEGHVYSSQSSMQTGADYAEFFEWIDNNDNDEDRVGYFVTFAKGKKIRIATKDDDYILGIVSGNPAIIGNADECWKGRYVTDEFGRYIKENITDVIDTIDEETGEIVQKTIEAVKYKEVPEYNPEEKYIPRLQRKEWSAVGMIGVLSVRDDGTCLDGGFCTVSDNGIATACSNKNNDNVYRVIRRITDNVIEVLFR